MLTRQSLPLYPQVVSDVARNSVHRFFDTSPLSPSARYVAVTSTPSFHRTSTISHDYKARYAAATVEVVDVTTGARRVVAETLAWDSQLGAQMQWGTSDHELYYNILEDTRTFNTTQSTTDSYEASASCPRSCATQTNGYWTIRGVQHDPVTSIARHLECPIYHTSSDGQHGIAPHLLKIHHTQKGYGVRLLYGNSVANANSHAPSDDGLYLTDITSGRCSIHTSLRQLATAAGIDTESTPIYGFHTKFSSDGALVMFIVRTLEAPSPPRTAPVRVQHLFVLPRTPHGDAPPRRMISWASYPFIPMKCFEKNASGVCEVVYLRDGNHPNWVPGSHKISMNLDVTTAPREGAETTASKLVKRTAKLVDALHEVSGMAVDAVRATAGERVNPSPRAVRQRQGKWSIVTIDVDAHAPGYMYHYNTPMQFTSSVNARVGATKPSPESTSPTAVNDRPALTPTGPGNNALHVTIDHPIGTGHPIYHPSGEYIITDAYPKETHLLSRDTPGGLSLQPGEVPLRLIQVSTQREVWLLKMQVERTTKSGNLSHAARWVDWMHSTATQAASLLLSSVTTPTRPETSPSPPSDTDAHRDRATSAIPGVTHSESAQLSDHPPARPNHHLPLPPHAPMLVEDKSWRCDLHPAWSRDFLHVAINGRPTGGERQVLLMHVGANLSVYFD